MKRSFVMLALATMLLAGAAPAFAADAIPKNDPTSAGLVEAPKKYDKTRVTFTGEAIGEVMIRGDYAWIHLNDDAYMVKNVEEGAALGGYNSGMAIWIPARLTKAIDTYGDYKHEGSIVTVSGTFNAACKEHGGDMDIHADTLALAVEGRHAADPVQPWKAMVAAGVALIAAGLWYLERLTRNRVRPHRGV
ncbi:MAG: hypothetical protein Q7W30_03775 [Coriobacteriia bacterium]|nr:hypothetical protein [Coriobacteriia bacterium]